MDLPGIIQTASTAASPGVGVCAGPGLGSLAPPGRTQLPLHVLAVEEVAEEKLILVEAAVGDDEGERPLHRVLQGERLQAGQGWHGFWTGDGRGWGSSRPHPLRLYCRDVE